jgi:predicted double-glycine peptidase
MDMNSAKKVLARYMKAVRALQSAGVATGLPVPAVQQTPGFCGPAALRAVLAFFDRDVSEEELAKLAGSNRKEGTTPEGLVRAARALGFKAQARDCGSIQDLQSWLDHGVPVIVDWFSTDEGHYSVVTAIQEGKVFMKDPEFGGKRELDVDSFERTWFDFERGDTRKHKGLTERVMIVVWP